VLPIYYMQVFRLLQGVIYRIISYIRRFLWSNKLFSGRPFSDQMVNPHNAKKEMGYWNYDIRAQNNALLLRWLWLIHSKPRSLWATKLRTHHDIQSIQNVLHIAQSASYFIQDLSSLLPLFRSCTQQSSPIQNRLWALSNDKRYSSKSSYDLSGGSRILIRGGQLSDCNGLSGSNSLTNRVLNKKN
jgi:hypothetical protein